jgi:hypothetical protein
MPKSDKSGDASRSTELAIVALQRSWRQVLGRKTGRQAEKRKWLDLEVTTAAHDSRAVSVAEHQSHRTIDPQCLENPRPEGAESTLTENAASPFQAEPTQGLVEPLFSDAAGRDYPLVSTHTDDHGVDFEAIIHYDKVCNHWRAAVGEVDRESAGTVGVDCIGSGGPRMSEVGGHLTVNRHGIDLCECPVSRFSVHLN